MMIKRIYILFLVFASIAILAASCGQDDAVIDSQADDNLQTYILYLDADAPSFEAVREGETRASGNSWEDGDVIYIAFSNGGNTKVSNATYKSSLGAFQFSSASLNAVSDASCSVYYFRGGSFSVSGNTVTMDKYTAIFTDTNAKYTCSSNVITMSAAFKPYTWRLCFKGTTGTQVKLKSSSNILYNTMMNLIIGSFSTNTGSETLNVRSDGYTPYVYGFFSGLSNTIKIEVGGVIYSRTLASSKLSVGESGYFIVPTSSDLHGWTKSSTSDEDVSLDINKEDYGSDKNLDNSSGGGVDNTGLNDINKEDYGSDKDLDNASGGGVDNTGSNDINKEGYGEDKNLD